MDRGRRRHRAVRGRIGFAASRPAWRPTPQKMNPPAWLGVNCCRQRPRRGASPRGGLGLIRETRLGRPWLAPRLVDAEAQASPRVTQVPHESIAGREGRGSVGERLFGRARLCPASGSKCVNATLSSLARPVWLSACSFGFRRVKGFVRRLKRVQASYGRRQEQVKGGSD